MPGPKSEVPLTEFEKLKRFFLWHRGKFALGLVRVNNPRQRDGVIASLQDELSREGLKLIRLDFSHRQVRSLLRGLEGEGIRQRLDARPDGLALAITGLEGSAFLQSGDQSRPVLFAALNLEREAIVERFPLPITLWLTDVAMDRLAEHAPDFHDFYSALFVLPSPGPPPERVVEPEIKAPYLRLPFSEALIAERMGILQGRIDELRRLGPTRPADILRLAQLLAEMADLYLASERAQDKTMAIPLLDEALRLCQELGERKGEADALAKIGEIRWWADQHEEARRRYEEALPIFREIGDRLGEANTIRALGHVHMALAEYGEARGLYQEALPIYREIGDRLGEANTIRSLGDVHRMLDEYGEARARYQEALPIYREIGHRLGEANTIKSLGDVHRMLAEYGEARARYQEALPIYREIGNRLGEANTIQALGDLHRSQKEYALALARYEEAIAIYQGIGDRYSIAQTLWRVGRVWAEQREIQRATEAFRKAEAIFREIGVRYWEEQCREVLEELEKVPG
jgi:tetratricopeptide (TPR) repeat protein